MKLTFIRHGQSTYNLKDLCDSKPGSRVVLTPRGRRQSREAAEKLKKEPFDAIFISQLLRTKQTATIINRYHNLPLRVDGRLNDRATGFQGRPAAEFYAWRDAQPSRWRAVPKDGESFEQMKTRLHAFLRDMRLSGFKNVLIVAHAPILKVARGYFLRLSNTKMDALPDQHVVNCRIMRFSLPRKVKPRRKLSVKK